MNIIKTITVSLLFSAALLAKESVIKWHTLLSEKRYDKIDASLEDIKKSILKNPVQEKKLSSALWRLLVDENLRENI